MSTLFIASLPALIILYHVCSRLNIDYCLNLLLHACAHDTVFNTCYDSNLSIYVCLLLHATWHSITTCWGVLTPLDPHVQVLELRACESFQSLIR